MNNIKAILWDYGNVLVDWQPRKLYETIFQDPKELDFFMSEVCPMHWHHQLDEGAEINEVIKKRQELFPQYTKEIAMWRDNFDKTIVGRIEDNVEILDTIDKSGMPQYCLTNMAEKLVDACFSSYNLENYFKDIIVSGVEKLAKPNPEIFELTLKRMGNPRPQEIFFIDDNKSNIETAKSMGFVTHHFKKSDSLRQALKEHNILKA